MKPNELDALIEDCLEGRLSEADAARLSAELQESPAARTRYWESASIHGLLEHTMQQASLRVITGEATPRPTRWLQWRPLMAAAAGIAIGIFCTSVVFAYVAPSLGKVITLLQESFESGPAPLVTGVPMEAGQWSGDYTEIVGEQQGVKPESGKKMLRFLRTDYEGKPNPDGGHVGDLYRLIDMRPYRKEFADGGAVVQLSAGFNTFEFPADERYGCSLTLYALDAETATNGSMRSGINPDEAPLAAQKRRMILDRSSATWQRLTSELRLPPDTDFLMARICIHYSVKSAPRQTFAGHYVDDVRLTIVARNPLP
ncbi:MAG: hypothetical protein ABIP85_26930 [Chthoniobacteraceae bacterium]